MTTRLLGVAAMLACVAMAWFGWKLSRRYSPAITHSGIGRPYPIRHSFLAFLGNAMIILALIGLFIAGMVTFA